MIIFLKGIWILALIIMLVEYSNMAHHINKEKDWSETAMKIIVAVGGFAFFVFGG